MNRKQKLDRIRNAFLHSTPDVTERIDLHQIQNLGPTIDPNLFLSTKPFPLTITYKRFAFLFTMVIALVIGTIYMGQYLPNHQDSTPKDFSYTELSTSEITPFSFAVVSGSMVLDQFMIELSADQLGFSPTNPNIWLIETRLDRFRKYVPIAYQMLSPIAQESIVVSDSDDINYQKMIQIPIKQINGTIQSMIGYFNITSDVTKEISGKMILEEQTSYFHVTYQDPSQIIYQFFPSIDETDKRIELTQENGEDSIVYHIKKIDQETIIQDSIIEKKDDQIKLILIEHNLIDIVFDISLATHMEVSYQIGEAPASIPSDAMFPAVGDYQFERSYVYEVGTIQVYIGVDIIASSDKLHFTITRPIYGTRTYVYDLED